MNVAKVPGREIEVFIKKRQERAVQDFPETSYWGSSFSDQSQELIIMRRFYFAGIMYGIIEPDWPPEIMHYQ
jgi:hypothetical protein